MSKYEILKELVYERMTDAREIMSSKHRTEGYAIACRDILRDIEELECVVIEASSKTDQ